MQTLRPVLGDQLSDSLASLRDAEPGRDVILMAEVREEATYVPHHKKKIAFVFSAMRHFAERLRGRGFDVRYIRYDDADNAGSLRQEIVSAARLVKPTAVVLTEPGEYRLKLAFAGLGAELAVPLEIREDSRFLCSHSEFRRWAAKSKTLRMEYFYREIRQRYNLLLTADGKPEGGKWNFDSDNRKPPAANMTVPRRIRHPQSPILKSVLNLVARDFPDNFGDLLPFHFALTAEQAEQELDHFVEHLLPRFGDFQDAMVAGEPYLYHSLLSAYLNAGLLSPLAMCRKAEAAYREGRAPLNAVEGFIRQIIGWREYVRGIYWLKMPGYAELNELEAKRPLPWFYWGGPTRMACIAEAVSHTREHAYSHHIQRLMVTGNFALLAGLDVRDVQDWYLAVYADAYEWVEMPNTLGMALFGDGGIMASKPYAASGKYIDRMSNLCSGCRYDPAEMTGEKACPFNSLYWDFMARHEVKLKRQGRIAYPLMTWNRFAPERQQAIRAQAADVLSRLDRGEL